MWITDFVVVDATAATEAEEAVQDAASSSSASSGGGGVAVTTGRRSCVVTGRLMVGLRTLVAALCLLLANVDRTQSIRGRCWVKCGE